MIDESMECIPSVTERYYTLRFHTDCNGIPGEDQCILFHSNKICVITLAKSHPIVAKQKKVTKVDFQVSNQLNRLTNKVSGKGKRGGQWLNEMSPLCIAHCEDDTRYTLYSCIRGKLVEVNENLIENPQLLTTKPESEGYIAIVLPKYGESDSQRDVLLSREEYNEKMALAE